ncbi:MAG: DeoR/GlpR family DNA-binding transcription regulator [Pseudomonadota bacterium]
MTVQETSQPLTDRQAAIVELVARNGYVTIERLAALFDVSTQTVRRDIIALDQSGRLQRFHGGAGPVGSESARLDYRAKRELGLSEKVAVGREAAALISTGATLYLDVGTTIETCARELARRPGFVVFTNSMPAAACFDPGEHQVFVLGGRMAGRDGSLVGDEVVDRLGDTPLDYAMIGCSAIDDAGRVMDFDLAKIAVKRAAMRAATTSVLLATRSKFNRSALATIAALDAFDAVVTEPV